MIRSWTPLINGTEECENCAGIDFDPLPAGTCRVEVAVSAPQSKPATKLHLA